MRQQRSGPKSTRGNGLEWIPRRAKDQLRAFTGLSRLPSARPEIVAGGCSGHSHRLFLDNQYDEAKDSRYKFHGEDLVVDKKSELFLDGATLDFIDGLEQLAQLTVSDARCPAVA